MNDVMMRLQEIMVLVVGFGKTGKAVTRFLLERDVRVTVNDSKSPYDVDDDFVELKERGAAFVLGSHPVDVFTEADLIVLSPGIDPRLQAVVAAREKGIPIISEIELASRFIDVPIIGVTGTNGKTTTATLIAEILSASGLSVYLGGNIGAPLIDFATQGMTADYVVAELSSFQLEGIHTFRPHIAVLLNITEDHLNRYLSFDAYRKAKYRVFINQAEDDIAIANYDDLNCRDALSQGAGRPVPFSQIRVMKPGMYAQGKRLFYHSRDGSVREYDLSRVTLQGPHNTQNLLAAVGSAEECGCAQDSIQGAIEKFKGLEHRLEFVQEIKGIPYYNDSKSTTIDSLLKALQTFQGNIILIAGGREKGGDYSILTDEIRRRTKLLIPIGEVQEKFCRLFDSQTHTQSATGLDEAVALAFRMSQLGDTVLFSPGCASFDMFSNYEERGRAFKRAVEQCAATVNEGRQYHG